MLLFDKKNFNDIDVNYLTFDNDFKIEVNKNKIKIIMGPNGIGKSSIYRNIQSINPEYSYIDYNKVEEAMLKNGDSLRIAAKISTIENKEREIKSILEKIDLNNNFKIFGLTSKPKCNNISSNLYSYKQDEYRAIEKFCGDNLSCLFQMDDDLKKLAVKNGKSLIDQLVEELKIKEIKDSYKKRYLEIIDNSLNGEEFVCPVCNSECSKPIKEIIKESLEIIKESTDTIVEDFIVDNPTSTPDIVLKKINTLKNVFLNNNIGISDIEDFIICGGSEEIAKYIAHNKKRINELKIDIASLEKGKEQFYNNVKKTESRIRDIFEKQLGIKSDNIVFDESNKEIRIKLVRDIEKYSTGEINLITFIVTLLSFINSDCDTLIIDDPLSSYDIPNQYRIIYEITKAYNNSCHILIFSHNIDCINIAHSQYKSAYDIELMDEINDKLYINPIVGLGDSGFNIDYIMGKLKNRTDFKYGEYITLLSEKDKWDSSNPDHQLFHYDNPYVATNGTSNNDELVDIIDNLSNNISNVDSIINSANKVLYLAAIRVWIEKQFYDNTDDLQGLQKQKFLGDKIIFMLDGNHWTGKSKLEKEYLMSKKVMLNQNEHVKSQREPFYYALSISTDDIICDILDIKRHFL